MVLWFGELCFAGNFSWKKTLKSLDAELPFSLQRISNFVRRFFCHFTAMDAWTSNWLIFGSLQLQTGCQFSWQIWWTCTSLFCWEHRTPRLANFVLFTDFFFRDDFELLEVFEHCTSIPVELTSWTTSLGKVPCFWGPSTSNWACEEAP